MDIEDNSDDDLIDSVLNDSLTQEYESQKDDINSEEEEKHMQQEKMQGKNHFTNILGTLRQKIFDLQLLQ